MNEDVKNIYNNLPSDVKQAIDSSNVPEKLQKIGNKYSLHMDKIGLLEQEVAAVMLGIAHPDSFVDRLEDRLNVSTEEAINIATDTNIEIFLAVRESLMKMHETPKDTVDREETKEKILAEIENPTPTIPPISKVDQTIPGPAAPREITPAKENIAHEFIAGKLTETVSLPPQKKTYPADPYREPLA